MSEMTHREFVESVWDRRLEWQQITPEQGVLYGFGEIYKSSVDTFPQPESAAWSAAFEFTSARLEEIRQVQEEIDDQKYVIEGWNSAAKFYECHAADDSMAATLFANHQHTLEIKNRTLARLQAALTELCKGIKPEKLKEMGVTL